MNQKFILSKLDDLDLYWILSIFLKMNYDKKNLEEANIVFRHLYVIIIVIDQIKVKGSRWFLDSAWNSSKFYDSIRFFDKDAVSTLQVFLSKEDEELSDEEKENLYDFFEYLEDLVIKWVKSNENFFDDYLGELNDVYQDKVLPIFQKMDSLHSQNSTQ